MKTDSFFYRFFSTFPSTFFAMIGEGEQEAAKYTFASIEVKELAFRIDGVFLPKTKSEPIQFVEVQFQKDALFYSRFFGEIFLYLRQKLPENNWRGVVIFPTGQADPGVHQHYKEFFESGRLQRIYLKDLHKTILNRYPINLLKIIIAPEAEVPQITKDLVRKLPNEIVDRNQQELIVELLISLLIQKLKNLTRAEVKKMVEPMISDIKESRFYREMAEEERREAQREEKRKIAMTLLHRQMSLEFIAEVTGLTKAEVFEISQQSSEQRDEKTESNSSPAE